MCNWAIGIGFDALWSNTNGKHRSRVFDEDSGEVISFNHTKTRLRNSLQLFGRLGYVIGGQVMPFVGLGWDNSAWKQKASFADSDGDHFRTHKRKRINSFLWKFGVDFLATKHCIIGAEYTGTAGGRLRAHKSFVEDDVTVKSHSICFDIQGYLLIFVSSKHTRVKTRSMDCTSAGNSRRSHFYITPVAHFA